MKFILLLLALTTTVFSSATQRGTQSYRVKGTFMCGSVPAKDVSVKLLDADFGKNADDELDAGFTNSKGFFALSGNTSELTTIDPQLKVYHDCNDGITPCQRRWKFELPNEFITSGSASPKVFDLGTWNLEALLPGESRDCVH